MAARDASSVPAPGPIDRSPVPLASSWRPWFESFARGLRAELASPRTIEGYGEALAQFAAFCAERGAVPSPMDVRREQIQEFIAHLGRTRKSTTAHNRYRGLKRFFNWLVDEGEIEHSPMERMKPPKLDEEPVATLSREDLTAVLKACQGTGFEERRDMALIRFLIDGGARRAEAASMSLENTDLDNGCAMVLAKGGSLREVYFGRKAARDLDRYLRVRARHRLADTKAFALGEERGLLTPFWLGQRGPLTGDGLYQVATRRFELAGLKPKSAIHVFRHTFSGEWKERGGSEEGLMTAAGWKSHAMLLRYGKVGARRRAQAEQKRLSLGDQL